MGGSVEVARETPPGRSPHIHVPEEDPEVAAVLETFARQAAGLGKTVVGTAAADLVHVREPDPGRPQGSAVAPIVADALKWRLNRSGIGVNIAIQNAGGVRNDIRAGDGYTAFAGLTGYDTGLIDTQAFLDYVSEKKIIRPLLFEESPGGDPGAWPHPRWSP